MISQEQTQNNTLERHMTVKEIYYICILNEGGSAYHAGGHMGKVTMERLNQAGREEREREKIHGQVPLLGVAYVSKSHEEISLVCLNVTRS